VPFKFAYSILVAIALRTGEETTMKRTSMALWAAILSILPSGVSAQEYAAERAWYEEEETKELHGYLGGLLAAGIGVNGQIDSGQKAYVDTSLLFALRGGLLVGRGSRWMLGFEVAPVSNRLDWRRRATATGFVSFGRLVPIRASKRWAWLWKIGLGVGGGFDYRFLAGFQLDVLTFNYKMNDRLWVDFGIPTMRFHIETASMARYNAQFVFPFGITFAI
jgi:hypothetical protein